jgi:phage-related tail fiber protein
MLIDGIKLVDGSSIINAYAESGTTFPSVGNSPGRMFYLTAPVSGNDKGLYVYNGSSWVTGDVTKIIAGTGMLGGGVGGDVTVSVDTSVIATVSAVNSIQSTLQTEIDANQNSAASSLTTAQNTLNASIATVQADVDANESAAATNLSNAQNTLNASIAAAVTASQPRSADLTAIDALSGTTGFLKKSATDTWALDTNTYLTGNQTITASGDATGSGTTSLALTLANSGVTAGTYFKTTVDAKGRVTAGTNPTTLVGFGITDGQPINTNLTAVANLTQNGIVVKTTGTTATVVAITGTAGRVVVSSGDGLSGNPVIDLGASGVGAGTYKSVTVDTYGRVVAGTNPSTLTTFGITDAVNKNGDSMIGNLVMPSGTRIVLADLPVNGTDAANKNYVDASIAGLSWKQAVKVATAGNIALTGLQTIDNVGVAIGDLVLVKSQTNPAENGIYVVAVGAWTRSTSFDQAAEIPGAATLVEFGTLYENSGFVCTTQAPVTVGTTAINFVQFNGASGVVPGTGLVKNGNTLMVAFGAGMTELPTNDIGINVYPLGGLLLTTDGSTSSSSVSAQLALSNTGVAGGSYNTVTVDTKGRVTAGSNAAYLLGNQNITVTGDATGSGATAIALTLANTGVAAGTYKSVQVDTKGRVVAGANPTTLVGYGITDAMQVGQVIDGGTF